MSAKPIYAMGVDAGSDRTRAVICLLEQGRLRLLGYGEAAAEGWLQSRIADQKAVAASILAARREAERVAQGRVGSAVLGTGGSTICCGTGKGGYEAGYSREFNQHDLTRVIERASHVRFLEDEMLLHLCVQDFSVDGRRGHRDPRGTFGSHLKAYVSLVTFSIQEHHLLVGAANLAELMVEETVFEPLAAAYACLKPEQRREGIAVIDIGAESTDLVVYYGDALVLASSLRLAGANFTRDVAKKLGLSFEEAEAVKIQHGCAMVGLTADTSVIEVPTPAGRQRREMPRDELNFVLEARAEQLFKYVRRELARVQMQDKLMGGVVLCGGTARLNGMCDVAEFVLKCPASWGLPVGIQDWPPALEDPAWATAAGLAMYSARLKQREMDGGSRGLIDKVLG
ncbi:MAG: cell division protein FtsA [Acidobacteriota bacterium]